MLDHPTSVLGGTVTDTDGKALAGIGIRVYTATNHLIDDTYTKSAGAWSLRGIAYVGKVKVVALGEDGDSYRTTWYASAVDFAHATPITVKEGSEITQLRITMPKK